MRMSRDVARLNPHLLGTSIEPFQPGPTKADAKNEKALQEQVENMLGLMGFKRRTPDELEAGPPKFGWVIHLHVTKRNPILLDILLLGLDGRYLELELKTRNRWQRGQKEIIAQGPAVLAHTFAEANLRVMEWLEGEGQ